MTLIIDRFTGLFGLIIIAFFSLLWNWAKYQNQPGFRTIGLVVFLLFLVVIIFYGVIFSKFDEQNDFFIRIINKVPQKKFLLSTYSAFRNYHNHKRTLIKALVISMIIHCLTAILFMLVAGLLTPQKIDFMIQFFVLPIGLFLVAIPIAPSGIGVGHLAFDTLYSLFAIDGGANIFNLFVFVQLSTNLFGGIVFLMYKSKYRYSELKTE